MDNVSAIIELMPEKLKTLLYSVDSEILSNVSEIRIRRKKPLFLYVDKRLYFISNLTKSLLEEYTNTCFVISDDMFDSIINRFCNNSYHTKMNGMIKGYITLNNGSRIGIASTASYKDGTVSLINDISSINIRVPHEIIGCSEKILSSIYKNNLPSIIVCAAPAGGKTTLLRDISRAISSGFNGEYKKVALIDEREEISSGYNVGINTDVLKAFSKKDGIEIAVRTLSPDIIICDEICSVEEVEKVREGFFSGAKFVVSAHLDGVESINTNMIVKSLIETDSFDYLVFLENYAYDCKIIDLRMNKNVEVNRRYVDNMLVNFGIGDVFKL